MPANQLTAKANVGAGTDLLAGVNTAQGFAGAAMLVHANGTDVTGAAPLPVTGPMTLAEYQSNIGTVVFDGPQPVALDSFATEDAPHSPGAVGMFVLAVRRDADTSAVSADGDNTPLLTDEAGRLKVAATPASFAAITGSIAAAAGTVTADVSRASNVMVYVTGTFAGHNCTFEGSIDGGTSWFGVQAVRSNANTVETTTGTLSSAPSYAWELSVNALTNFRVRATTHVSGTANWRIQPGSYATEPIPAAQVTGTQPVSGTVTAAGGAAHSSVASGNPVQVGGVVRTTYDLTLAVSDACSATMTTGGAQTVKPFSVPDLDWSYASAAGGINNTTDVSIKAAAGVNLRNYLTGISIVNSSATTASEVVVKDGATVIGRWYVGTGSAIGLTFPSPLRSSSNTALNVACITTAATVYVNAQGYVAP